jgi:hypothetical protein
LIADARPGPKPPIGDDTIIGTGEREIGHGSVWLDASSSMRTEQWVVMWQAAR